MLVVHINWWCMKCRVINTLTFKDKEAKMNSEYSLGFPLKSEIEDPLSSPPASHEERDLLGNSNESDDGCLPFDPIMVVKTELRRYDSDEEEANHSFKVDSIVSKKDSLIYKQEDNKDGDVNLQTVDQVQSLQQKIQIDNKRFSSSGSKQNGSQIESLCQDHLQTFLEMHTDEKSFVCESCGKEFCQRYKLKRHMVVHSGEKPYRCDDCGKAFPYKSSFRSHLRMHTGEKPFSCSECEEAFSERKYLKVHMKIHTGEKPITCNVCGKEFSQNSCLTRHMRSHTGERRYSCTECDRPFLHRWQLGKHMRTHTGERPYRCDECRKSFSRKSHLITHMRIHTGDTPFTCSECGKAFSHRCQLRKHMNSHTGENP
ncbi:gastrula zinc finger protein XlCGF57.1-like [Palaemon carinicauda]|uniref:gastrula zinc finger protein XlCGF57.1-like n=1 Tax=Palaemon carinicauda TaxID=392227 RepID=UPI0035B57C49